MTPSDVIRDLYRRGLIGARDYARLYGQITEAQLESFLRERDINIPVVEKEIPPPLSPPSPL